MVRIYYFPEPYPDELIGSVLIRAGRHLGHSIKKTHSLLGLTPRYYWTLFFQNSIQTIASVLAMPADELLFAHTPFPYVSAFLSREQTQSLTDYYLSPHVSSAALSQSATKGGAIARFCEECVTDDQREFGEDFWHRRHNLPLVTRCWKHGSRLQMSNRRRGGISVIGLPHEQLGTTTVMPTFDEHIHALIEPTSVALLDSTFRQPTEEWQKGYRQMAHLRGFPGQGRLLSSQAITEGFIAYYGQTSLKRAGLEVPDKPDPWPVTLLRRNQTAHVTARHILMQIYLQYAPVPDFVHGMTPGPKPLNCQEMDAVFATVIRKRVSTLPQGSRITVTSLLNHLDILQQVRHHRKSLPLTVAAISDFRSTEFSVKKIGRRARKRPIAAQDSFKAV